MNLLKPQDGVCHLFFLFTVSGVWKWRRGFLFCFETVVCNYSVSLLDLAVFNQSKLGQWFTSWDVERLAECCGRSSFLPTQAECLAFCWWSMRRWTPAPPNPGSERRAAVTSSLPLWCGYSSTNRVVSESSPALLIRSECHPVEQLWGSMDFAANHF